MNLVTGYRGQKHITSADVRKQNAMIFGEGQVVFTTDDTLKATIVSNNKITIGRGALSMNGAFAKLEANQDMAIENGNQGRYRNDLIVARYNRDTGTGIESVNLVVVKGDESTTSAVDPTNKLYNGSVLDGSKSTVDMPLYRVRLNGINIAGVDTLFELAMQSRIKVVSSVPQQLGPDGTIYLVEE